MEINNKLEEERKIFKKEIKLEMNLETYLKIKHFYATRFLGALTPRNAKISKEQAKNELKDFEKASFKVNPAKHVYLVEPEILLGEHWCYLRGPMMIGIGNDWFKNKILNLSLNFDLGSKIYTPYLERLAFKVYTYPMFRIMSKVINEVKIRELILGRELLEKLLKCSRHVNRIVFDNGDFIFKDLSLECDNHYKIKEISFRQIRKLGDYDKTFEQNFDPDIFFKAVSEGSLKNSLEKVTFTDGEIYEEILKDALISNNLKVKYSGYSHSGNEIFSGET